MTDLLSVEEMGAFMAAMDDLKDTFHKDTCVFMNTPKPFSLMDNTDADSPTETSLDCRVTKKADSAKADRKIEGVEDENAIEIRFFSRYLRANNLMTGNVPVFQIDKDMFRWQNNRYQLRMISYDDSDIAGDVVMVVCHCEKMVNAV
jgi:hypothetical protein